MNLFSHNSVGNSGSLQGSNNIGNSNVTSNDNSTPDPGLVYQQQLLQHRQQRMQFDDMAARQARAQLDFMKSFDESDDFNFCPSLLGFNTVLSNNDRMRMFVPLPPGLSKTPHSHLRNIMSAPHGSHASYTQGSPEGRFGRLNGRPHSSAGTGMGMGTSHNPESGEIIDLTKLLTNKKQQQQQQQQIAQQQMSNSQHHRKKHPDRENFLSILAQKNLEKQQQQQQQQQQQRQSYQRRNINHQSFRGVNHRQFQP